MTLDHDTCGSCGWEYSVETLTEYCHYHRKRVSDTKTACKYWELWYNPETLALRKVYSHRLK